MHLELIDAGNYFVFNLCSLFHRTSCTPKDKHVVPELTITLLILFYNRAGQKEDNKVR